MLPACEMHERHYFANALLAIQIDLLPFIVVSAAAGGRVHGRQALINYGLRGMPCAFIVM
jgi:hypothetical protein